MCGIFTAITHVVHSFSIGFPRNREGSAAERLSKSRSEIVREAIRDYSERIGKLSEQERLRMLDVFDEVVARIPSRPLAEVERELKEVRSARRGAGAGCSSLDVERHRF